MRIQLWLSLFTLCGLVACDNKPPVPTADSAAKAATTATNTASSKLAGKGRPPLLKRTRSARPQPKPIPAPADVAAPPADAKKTNSGLASKVLKEGTGDEMPDKYAQVTVHYTGWTADGKMFDSSVSRGQPAHFRVNGVIKGWTEALQLMKKGEKRRLWIPADLAYGAKPPPGTPAGQLTFDVELLDYTAGPKPPETPADLKNPPASAIKTASGLRYRYLTKGKGDKSPTANDYVTVHYSGWTMDGVMFDSTVVRQRPQPFHVGSLIQGWREGLMLMKQGDKLRMWIPADLAYGEKPKRKGAPAGALVFDVELIAIRPPARGHGGPGMGRHGGNPAGHNH